MTLEETCFVGGHWDLRHDLYNHTLVLNVGGSSRETES